jgi:hypothetical protein
MSSVFTPPGANAANAQASRNAEVAKKGLEQIEAIQPFLMDLLKTYLPMMSGPEAKARAKANAQMIDRTAQSLRHQAGYLRSPLFAMDVANQLRNQTLEQGLQGARTLQASTPADPSLATAAQLAALNSSNRAYSDALAQNLSSEAVGKRGMAEAQLANATLGLDPSQSYLASIGNLAQIFNQGVGTVYGQPQVQMRPGFGEILGQIAGAWAGSGFTLPK